MSSLEQLHAELVSGDLRAASKIVACALAPMIRLVSQLVPKLHHDHEDACLDALLDYLQVPAAYDPTRAKLLTYLTNKAVSKARTAVRTQTRRQSYEHRYAVTREVTVGDSGGGEQDLLEKLHLQELLDAHGDAICCDAGDGEILLLMAAGERHCEPYLEALDLEDTLANRADVDRRRDRIRGRLRRLQPQLQD